MNKAEPLSEMMWLNNDSIYGKLVQTLPDSDCNCYDFFEHYFLMILIVNALSVPICINPVITCCLTLIHYLQKSALETISCLFEFSRVWGSKRCFLDLFNVDYLWWNFRNIFRLAILVTKAVCLATNCSASWAPKQWRCFIYIANSVDVVAFSKFHKTKKQKIFSGNFYPVKFALPTLSEHKDTRIWRYRKKGVP